MQKVFFETTKEIIDDINVLAKQKRLTEDNVKELLFHLNQTIKQGKIVDEVKLGEHCGMPEIRKIYNEKDLAIFLNLKNPALKKMSAKFVLDYLCEKYLDDYNNKTTPHRAYAETMWLESPKHEALVMHSIILLLDKNQDVYEVKDIESFANAFVKTLYARQKHCGLIMSNELELIKRTDKTIEVMRPAYIYKKMTGMYAYDMENLNMLAKILAKRGGKLSCIQNAVNEIPLQLTELDNPNSVYVQEKIFALYKNMIMDTINCPNKYRKNSISMKDKVKNMFTVEK